MSSMSHTYHVIKDENLRNIIGWIGAFLGVVGIIIGIISLIL
jgi:hypothetical protein